MPNKHEENFLPRVECETNFTWMTFLFRTLSNVVSSSSSCCFQSRLFRRFSGEETFCLQIFHLPSTTTQLKEDSCDEVYKLNFDPLKLFLLILKRYENANSLAKDLWKLSAAFCNYFYRRYFEVSSCDLCFLKKPFSYQTLINKIRTAKKIFIS